MCTLRQEVYSESEEQKILQQGVYQRRAKDRYKRQRQGNRAAVEDNLQRCAREAREAGMSYGQYMAMKY